MENLLCGASLFLPSIYQWGKRGLAVVLGHMQCCKQSHSLQHDSTIPVMDLIGFNNGLFFNLATLVKGSKRQGMTTPLRNYLCLFHTCECYKCYKNGVGLDLVHTGWSISKASNTNCWGKNQQFLYPISIGESTEEPLNDTEPKKYINIQWNGEKKVHGQEITRTRWESMNFCFPSAERFTNLLAWRHCLMLAHRHALKAALACTGLFFSSLKWLA